MVICFSGEGNSRYVAELIARSLDLDIVMLENRLILDPASAHLSVSHPEPVIWVFPVYSWGVPPVVVKFVKEVIFDGASAAQHHLVLTCGDDTGLAHKQWRRLVASRGWNALTASSVQMPNTYTLMKGFDVDPKAVEDAKLAAVPHRVEEVLANILNGDSTVNDVVTGSWAWVKSRVIYPYFIRFCMSPAPFRATDSCVGCSKCAKACPMDNITMTSSHIPAWGRRCALCLRCYHVCPHHAVEYGKATISKGQYLCPKHSDK